MRRILDSFLSYKEYLALAGCVLLSISLLAVEDNPQVKTIRSITVVSIGYLQEGLDLIPDYFDLKAENRILREQNLTLSEELSRLREASLENVRLRRLLSMGDRQPYTYRAANVVGKNFQYLRNTITLDIGEDEGVLVDMPVVTHNGLAGKIAATSAGYSVAQVLYHRQMKTSAKVQRSRVDGILGWDGGEHLTLENVAKTLDVQPGDRVITSEYSNIFPAGIPIGFVSRTYVETGALFQTIEVVPIADLHRLEEVFVIATAPDEQRTTLEQEGLR